MGQGHCEMVQRYWPDVLSTSRKERNGDSQWTNKGTANLSSGPARDRESQQPGRNEFLGVSGKFGFDSQGPNQGRKTLKNHPYSSGANEGREPPTIQGLLCGK